MWKLKCWLLLLISLIAMLIISAFAIGFITTAIDNINAVNMLISAMLVFAVAGSIILFTKSIKRFKTPKKLHSKGRIKV